MIRTYIETLLEMPWDRSTQDHNDLEYAGMVLEEDHYGLEQVKRESWNFWQYVRLQKKEKVRYFVLWDRRVREKHRSQNRLHGL